MKDNQHGMRSDWPLIKYLCKTYANSVGEAWQKRPLIELPNELARDHRVLAEYLKNEEAELAAMDWLRFPFQDFVLDYHDLDHESGEYFHSWARVCTPESYQRSWRKTSPWSVLHDSEYFGKAMIVYYLMASKNGRPLTMRDVTPEAFLAAARTVVEAWWVSDDGANRVVMAEPITIVRMDDAPGTFWPIPFSRHMLDQLERHDVPPVDAERIERLLGSGHISQPTAKVAERYRTASPEMVVKVVQNVWAEEFRFALQAANYLTRCPEYVVEVTPAAIQAPPTEAGMPAQSEAMDGDGIAPSHPDCARQSSGDSRAARRGRAYSATASTSASGALRGVAAPAIPAQRGRLNAKGICERRVGRAARVDTRGGTLSGD